MATIKEVAELAGVSVATVSRFMNNSGYVGKASREKVEKAIKLLDFSPNEVARSLYQKKSKLIGLLLPDIAKALFPELPEAEQLRIIDGCCQAEHEALLRKCAPLYPDLEKTLKILSSRFPLFIVSNCQAGYIEVFLKSTGFGHYFKGHLCPGDTGMAKAENIMKIREDNNLSDPVYIGDTIGDFNACRKAGVPFIFAEYGFGQVDKPDYRITRPFDLTEICR